MSSSLISWGKFLLGWPLSLISVGFILKIIYDKSSEANISLSDINLFYLLFGILLMFAYYLLRSFLWLQQLKEKGESVGFISNTYMFAFSELKRFAPGNIWSFLSRANMFSEKGVSKKTIGISTLGDIQLVIIGSGLVSIFSIPWLLDSPRGLQERILSILPLSLIAIAVFLIVTSVIYKRKYKEGSLMENLVLPGFKFESKIKLIIISFLTYFVFGLGNFFFFLSVFNHGFNEFLTISSFFTFSLLIGYLSFITPMGLGVREGIVTLGLLKITSLTTAGLIAIYSRIALIISELLFLALIYLWKNLSRK